MELKITTNIGETFNIGSTVIKITYLKCRMFYSVNVVVVRESRQIKQLFLKYLIDIPHRGFIGLKMYFFFHDSIAIVSRKKKKNTNNNRGSVQYNTTKQKCNNSY